MRPLERNCNARLAAAYDSRLAKEIGTVKHKNRWSLLSVARWREIIASRTAWGSELGLSREFLSKILTSVHEESIRVQGDEANKRRAKQKK